MSTVQTQQITGVWHADPKHSNLTLRRQAQRRRHVPRQPRRVHGHPDASGDELRLSGTGGSPASPPATRTATPTSATRTSSTPSSTPSCASPRRRSRSTATTRRHGRPDAPRRDAPRRAARHARGPGRRRVRHHPLSASSCPARSTAPSSASAGTPRCPAATSSCPTRSASRRPSRSCRRPDHAPPRHLRQPPGRLVQLAAAGRGGRPRPGRLELLGVRRPARHPAVRRRRRGARTGRGGRVPRGPRGCGRGAHLDAGVQLVHPGAAQERPGLGLPALRDQRAAQPPGRS